MKKEILLKTIDKKSKKDNQTEKKIKAWAIMPSFPDNKKLEKYPFLTENRQFMIYITKKAAEKDNENMDESVEPCEIIFNSQLKLWKKKN